MQESIHPITEKGLNSWKEAILEYKSQLPVLGEAFDTPEKAQKSIHSFWERYKGMRLLQMP
jgi:hypothetical protein